MERAENIVYPGIHTTAQNNINELFTEKENKIARRWGEQFYITRRIEPLSNLTEIS